MDAKISELKHYSTLESLQQLVEYHIPVDSWFETFPDDIENWKTRYELTSYPNNESYKVWVKYIDLEDDILVNAYIQTIKL